jgi:hypothetical protein
MRAAAVHTVVTLYFCGQWTIFYIARYRVHIEAVEALLGMPTVLYALRHLYGHRHIGLTLGGVGSAQLQTQMHTRSPRDDERLRTGTHVDTGHAEDHRGWPVDGRSYTGQR